MKCPRCGVMMTLGTSDEHRRSRDHIIPREWRRPDTPAAEWPWNVTKVMCQRCNGLRAEAGGHCWGAVACLQAVAADLHVDEYTLALKWGMAPARYGTVKKRKHPRVHKPKAPPGFKAEPVVGIIPGGYIFPADTPGKQVWNLAVLVSARAGNADHDASHSS